MIRPQPDAVHHRGRRRAAARVDAIGDRAHVRHNSRDHVRGHVLDPGMALGVERECRRFGTGRRDRIGLQLRAGEADGAEGAGMLHREPDLMVRPLQDRDRPGIRSRQGDFGELTLAGDPADGARRQLGEPQAAVGDLGNIDRRAVGLGQLEEGEALRLGIEPADHAALFAGPPDQTVAGDGQAMRTGQRDRVGRDRVGREHMAPGVDVSELVGEFEGQPDRAGAVEVDAVRAVALAHVEALEPAVRMPMDQAVLILLSHP